MKKRVVKLDNGSVAIVIPSQSATPESIERICSNIPGHVSNREIEDSELPVDRAERGLWVDNPKSKAIEIINN